MCLGVESFALVLNEMFGIVGDLRRPKVLKNRI
jgi:hypothetical protein